MAYFKTLYLLYPFIAYGLCEDTVADDIGPHMIMRIAEYLTVQQCQILYTQLTEPVENNDIHIQEPSPSTGQEKPIGLEFETKEQCKNSLKNLVEAHEDSIYWDRLLIILYKLGRFDLATEISNNLNWDKMWELKQSMEDLHNYFQKLKPSLRYTEEEKNEENVRVQRDLARRSTEDWDINAKQKQLPQYSYSLFAWFWSLFYGVIFGFIGSAVLGGLIVLFTIWFLGSDHIDPNFIVPDLPFDYQH